LSPDHHEITWYILTLIFIEQPSNEIALIAGSDVVVFGWLLDVPLVLELELVY